MNEQYICYIGRPSYQKNSLFFIDVVNGIHERHPEVKFKLLGIGFFSPELSAVEEKIAQYGLKDVIEMIPWLNHEDTMTYVSNSLFYMSVARYEGLPLAIIEAMALEKPIIASDVVGNKDCVRHNYNGWLVPLDTTSFVTAACKMIEDDNTRDIFGKNSRTLFEDKFLINKRIVELENIYRNT